MALLVYKIGVTCSCKRYISLIKEILTIIIILYCKIKSYGAVNSSKTTKNLTIKIFKLNLNKLIFSVIAINNLFSVRYFVYKAGIFRRQQISSCLPCR